MGDGGTIPNLGQSQLNLSDTEFGRDIRSVFQIAAVTCQWAASATRATTSRLMH